MALNARTEIYIQQPATPQNPSQQPARKKSLITKGEKILYSTFITVCIMCALLVLQNQSTIQASTQEIQTIEQSVNEKTKQNTDLSVQVSELSSYERIWSKAKELGLKLNEQNVKVVPGQ
ncbi:MULTISPECIES: cell division protein FtsL [Planococcus]|uniref:Cell division protein FtsL n=2 Tax=Planococcus TaxID=1372 RepID=A0ABN4JT88_9BACL|nr:MULTISPECIES: cell division protein FtsL [Planococcus]ALS78199.1 cell division protein FtsL [Planococcus kocurii]AQU79899.1 cell division protein FtsL [Planococcus faecalis]KAA0958410.1 cell division protein FtsL [Planococcus sp. ANT_H30]MDJ0330737.1 cell division protein FtsL [Planococcus sp. S3-L1]OHX53448.1 cell division protein FtsL [Planococcus faecalis]